MQYSSAGKVYNQAIFHATPREPDGSDRQTVTAPTKSKHMHTCPWAVLPQVAKYYNLESSHARGKKLGQCQGYEMGAIQLPGHVPEATAHAFVWASKTMTNSPVLKVVIPQVSCFVLENSRLMPVDDPRPSCSAQNKSFRDCKLRHPHMLRMATSCTCAVCNPVNALPSMICYSRNGVQCCCHHKPAEV